MSFGEKAYNYFYAMTQRNIDGIKASFVVTIFAAYTTGLIYFFLIEPHLNKMINALVSEIFSVERSREKN